MYVLCTTNNGTRMVASGSFKCTLLKPSLSIIKGLILLSTNKTLSISYNQLANHWFLIVKDL